MNPLKAFGEFQAALVSTIERSAVGIADAVFDAGKRLSRERQEARAQPYFSVALAGEEKVSEEKVSKYPYEQTRPRTVLGGGWVRASAPGDVGRVTVACHRHVAFDQVVLSVEGMWMVRQVLVGTACIGGGFIAAEKALNLLMPIHVGCGEAVVFEVVFEPPDRPGWP